MEETDLQEMGLGFLRHVGRHLGCLVVNYVRVDCNGQDTGCEQVASFSGFFTEMDGKWFFTTAGHVLDDESKGVETHRRAGRIRILQTRILDCFGDNARDQLPTIISYDDVRWVSLDDDELGLDFAFVHLRPGYVQPIRANGVTPFTPRDFYSPNHGSPIAFGILGFPEEEKQSAGDDERNDGRVRPVLVWVQPCDPPEGSGQTAYPRFVAKLPYDMPRKVDGLSGGPVMAFVRKGDGSVKMYLLGVQSAWLETSRVVFACPMSSIIQFMLDQLDGSQ